jgi:hypothetical protein
MPYDALIIGLIVLFICAAACFYLYMRISFIERKGGMMESVIVDLKMAIDSLMNSGMGGGHAPIPISPQPAVQMSAPAPLDPAESEPIPEEGFYSSVLEQAHDEAAATPAEAQVGISLEKAMEGLTETETAAEPELDSMTKNDLLAEAEKRGLRAKKSSSREQLLTLLRRSAPLQNSGNTPGADGNGAASLDGSVNVDLGQGAALD